MKALLLSVSILVLAVAVFGHATARSDNPLTNSAKVTSDMVRGYISKAADQVPEKLYAYKPTPEVRSFGQLLGHIAESNYAICAAAANEKPPVTGIEKAKTTKADLTKVLAESFAYCDTVFSSTTDENGAELVRFEEAGMDVPRLTMLSFNMGHNFEHYGNIVTYMRMNKMVPPSSQGNMGR